LLGRYDEAERAYEDASRHGFEPQPGLALLWLARGRTEAARAAVVRLLAETRIPAHRHRLLAAAVEIHLAATSSSRLAGGERAAGPGPPVQVFRLQATAAHAAGPARLETGDAAGALPYLRKAMQQWTELGCPYEAARAQVLIGRACATLGDADSSAKHLDLARRVFADQGTYARLWRSSMGPGARPTGSPAREVEVLRLVAAGKSNAQIAAALVLSERTVARHLSNIFTKIDVPSRTAAAAYAYEHGWAERRSVRIHPFRAEAGPKDAVEPERPRLAAQPAPAGEVPPVRAGHQHDRFHLARRTRAPRVPVFDGAGRASRVRPVAPPRRPRRAAVRASTAAVDSRRQTPCPGGGAGRQDGHDLA
jgi:DNA-binding CsgD family transcriptional regulator